jgi:hypothetical protein
LADEIFGLAAELPGRKTVHVFNAVIPVDDEDRVVRGLGQRTIAFLALPQRRLRPLALGDVADNAGDRVPAVFDEIIEGELEGDLRAVLVAAKYFDGVPVYVPLRWRCTAPTQPGASAAAFPASAG